MLQLTKRTEYGLIALSHLVGRQGEFVSVREICERYPVPRRLVAEVLKDLCRNGILDSQRGATGGYALTRPPESITVGTVVGALEGEPVLASCQSGNDFQATSCEVEGVCPIRDPILRLRVEFWQLLERMDLKDLVRSPLPGSTATSSSFGPRTTGP